MKYFGRNITEHKRPTMDVRSGSVLQSGWSTGVRMDLLPSVIIQFCSVFSASLSLAVQPLSLFLSIQWCHPAVTLLASVLKKRCVIQFHCLTDDYRPTRPGGAELTNYLSVCEATRQSDCVTSSSLMFIWCVWVLQWLFNFPETTPAVSTHRKPSSWIKNQCGGKRICFIIRDQTRTDVWTHQDSGSTSRPSSPSRLTHTR